MSKISLVTHSTLNVFPKPELMNDKQYIQS